MRCILAIDAGGSKCESLLADEDGRIRNRGYCSVFDPDSGRGPSGSGRSVATVTESARRALAGQSCDALIPVSTGSDMDLSRLPEWAGVLQPALIYAEWQIALFGAGLDEGIMALAGTGAVVALCRRNARPLMLDGAGPVIGDLGSGWHIGLLALQAVLRAGWHARHRTALREPVMEAVSGWRVPRHSHLNGLFSQVPMPDRAEVAALAQLVDHAAEAGDPVAIGILEHAAGILARTVLDAADAGGAAARPLTVVGIGSVATRSRVYWQTLCRTVSEGAPQLRAVLNREIPAKTLARLALRDLGVTDWERVAANLERSAADIGWGRPGAAA